jgi:muramoyltetrapeptide carboxypeptidase
LGEHLYTKFSNGYNYAGTEKERIKDINWALNDKEIVQSGLQEEVTDVSI